MVDNKTFRKILYMVAYILAAIFFIVGVLINSNSLIGLATLHLIIGGVFNIRYLIYTIKHEKEN